MARKDWADTTAIRTDPPVTLRTLQECGDIDTLWTPLVDFLQKLCGLSLLFWKTVKPTYSVQEFEVDTTRRSANIAEAQAVGTTQVGRAPFAVVIWVILPSQCWIRIIAPDDFRTGLASKGLELEGGCQSVGSRQKGNIAVGTCLLIRIPHLFIPLSTGRRFSATEIEAAFGKGATWAWETNIPGTGFGSCRADALLWYFHLTIGRRGPRWRITWVKLRSRGYVNILQRFWGSREVSIAQSRTIWIRSRGFGSNS